MVMVEPKNVYMGMSPSGTWEQSDVKVKVKMNGFPHETRALFHRTIEACKTSKVEDAVEATRT